MQTSSLELLARQLADSFRCEDEALCRQLLRLLASGHSVSQERLAASLQMTTDQVKAALARLSDTEFDEGGNIVGWGLTLIPTPHRFQVNGLTLYTWCALDALTYPALLKQRARVESACPITGRQVALSITPTGIEDLAPASAVVSLVIPASTAACDCDRAAFCNQGHFLSSREAASVWQASHQNALILSVQDAYQLGLMLAQYRYEGISGV